MSHEAPTPRPRSASDARALTASQQSSEVLVFSASSEPALNAALKSTAQEADGMAADGMAHLAARCASRLETPGPWRAACVATDPADLRKQLTQLLERQPGAPVVPTRRGRIWLGQVTGAPPRIGFVYPGQGSQRLEMARQLVERHPWAGALAAQADGWVRAQTGEALLERMHPPRDPERTPEQQERLAARLAQTEVTQPAIVLASMLLTEQLRRLGITPVAVAGHSLGELTAFHAAGRLDAESVLRLAAVRGQLMSAGATEGGVGGEMVALGCDAAGAERLLAHAPAYAAIANINSPSQTVVSCEPGATAYLLEQATAAGVSATKLTVSNGFHSKFVAGAADALTRAPLQLRSAVAGNSAHVLSSLPEPPPPGEDLKAHFARHLRLPLDFVGLTQRLAAQCDVLLEVGPGRALSHLIEGTLGRKGACLPVEIAAGQWTDLQATLAALFVRGTHIVWSALHAV